ncbi:MAG: hypothetical protein V4618_17080 [Pseudomonadota bacterium]
MTDLRTPDAPDGDGEGDTPTPTPTDGTPPDVTTSDDMTRARAILMTQAVDLDVMFSELIGKAASNLDQWPTMAERFVRLALRAQANCRASLDTLARADRAQRRLAPRDADTPA